MKSGCLVAGGLALACLGGAAVAQGDLDSMMRANELGSILASEDVCGLTLDQDGIAGWIAKNVANDDLGFAANLQLMTQGQAFQLQNMSESAKTAHCTAISMTAINAGLIK